ncbi:class I SAM-dependent methyltransferase [Pseudomonadota bacterium]
MSASLIDCKHEGRGKVLFFARDYISGTEFAVRECCHCRLVYTDLSYTDQAVVGETFYPADYYGRQKRYPLFLGKILNYFVMHRARLLGEEEKKASGAILDIGCGQGLFLKQFADRGWQAVGIEVSSSAAFHAREVQGLDVLVGKRTTEELANDSFDIISLWHVLEHADQPKTLLSEARRVLKTDGKLLLSVPNFSSLEARLGKQNWFHLDVPRHITHFTQDGLQTTLDATGWEITKKSYFTPEYDFFSFIQTAQNMCGLEMNLLYRIIRSGNLRKEDAPNPPLIQKILAILSFPLFALISLAYVPIVNLMKQGSSVNLILKKKTC